ncbi:hypothetical protein N7493_010089 [Penicillium malachiteum]|uniref:Uncharacterized protein n=1 Tax=Penicillium malachiteum TaxID=1324776 RepID=A0AAD6HEC9_9EURO|nr:hypothetical protein N7493_010089 [Penicillium malachiteum]
MRVNSRTLMPDCRRASEAANSALFERTRAGLGFSSIQDTALCNWIDHNYRYGTLLTRQEARKAATAMLRLSDPSCPLLDSRWFGRWLRNHPGYSNRCLLRRDPDPLASSGRTSPCPSASPSEDTNGMTGMMAVREINRLVNKVVAETDPDRRKERIEELEQFASMAAHQLKLGRFEREMARVREEDTRSARNALEDESEDEGSLRSRYPPGFSLSVIKQLEQRWEDVKALNYSLLGRNSCYYEDSENLKDREDEALLKRYPPGLFSVSLIKKFEQRWKDIKPLDFEDEEDSADLSDSDLDDLESLVGLEDEDDEALMKRQPSPGIVLTTFDQEI